MSSTRYAAPVRMPQGPPWPPVDEDARRSFRSVAGRFATGVAVATTCLDGAPVGMTVNSFTTVSMDPVLSLLVCLNRQSRLLSAVRRSGVFALTVLSAEQRDCARWFATSGRPSGAAGFAGIPHGTDPDTGCPLLTDGVAYFSCGVTDTYPAGSHLILVGAVRSCGLLRSGAPLVFLDGRYDRLAERSDGDRGAAP